MVNLKYLQKPGYLGQRVTRKMTFMLVALKTRSFNLVTFTEQPDDADPLLRWYMHSVLVVICKPFYELNDMTISNFYRYHIINYHCTARRVSEPFCRSYAQLLEGFVQFYDAN